MYAHGQDRGCAGAGSVSMFCIPRGMRNARCNCVASVCKGCCLHGCLLPVRRCVVGGASGNGIHTRATRPVASFEFRVAGGDVRC
eukprot:955367-Prymnesium_polylepis.1